MILRWLPLSLLLLIEEALGQITYGANLINNPTLLCDTSAGCVDPSGGGRSGASYAPQGWSTSAHGGGSFANANVRATQGIFLSDTGALGDTSLWQDVGTTVGGVYRITYQADPCYSDGVAWMSVTFGTDTLESNPFSSCNGIARAGTGIRIFWVNATSATTRFQLTAGLSSSNQNDFYNHGLNSVTVQLAQGQSVTTTMTTSVSSSITSTTLLASVTSTSYTWTETATESDTETMTITETPPPPDPTTETVTEGDSTFTLDPSEVYETYANFVQATTTAFSTTNVGRKILQTTVVHTKGGAGGSTPTKTGNSIRPTTKTTKKDSTKKPTKTSTSRKGSTKTTKKRTSTKKSTSTKKRTTTKKQTSTKKASNPTATPTSNGCKVVYVQWPSACCPTKVVPGMFSRNGKRDIVSMPYSTSITVLPSTLRSTVVFSSTDLDVVEDATTTTFTAIETSTEYETLDPADPETVYLTETADVVTETPDPVTYTLLGDEETQWVTRTRPKTVSSTYTVTATLYVNRRRSVELPAVTPAPGSVGPVGRSEERAQVLSLESRACPVALYKAPYTCPSSSKAKLTAKADQRRLLEVYKQVAGSKGKVYVLCGGDAALVTG